MVGVIIVVNIAGCHGLSADVQVFYIFLLYLEYFFQCLYLRMKWYAIFGFCVYSCNCLNEIFVQALNINM